MKANIIKVTNANGFWYLTGDKKYSTSNIKNAGVFNNENTIEKVKSLIENEVNIEIIKVEVAYSKTIFNK